MPLDQLLTQIERAFAPVRQLLVPILSSPALLAVWVLVVAASVTALLWDLRSRNRALSSLMQFVWVLTVLYSGPLGLGLYWYAGRTQISHDSPWRRGVRSTAHCYSGCGAGEVVGITLAQGVLALATVGVAAATFALAYLFGFALTVGPLLQDGETLRNAVLDALWSETPSITVMEVTAIGADLLLASQATLGDPLFWASLALSLSIGFAAAYPVNLVLVRFGVKEGMADPSQMETGRSVSAGD